MKERAIELRVGLLVLAAIVIAGGFFVLLGNLSLSRGYDLHVDFDYSGDLQAGAPVKVSGIKVGKVEEVALLGGALDAATGRHVQVRVAVWLEDRTRGALHDDASFFINTAGVLGEQYLEIVPGRYDRPLLPPGSTVVGVNPPRTDLIVARLYEFLDSMTTLLHDDRDVIARLLVRSTDLVSSLDDTLVKNQDEISALLGDSDGFVREAAGLSAGLRRGVGDGTAIADTLHNVDTLSGTLATRSPPLFDQATATLGGVERVTALVGPTEKADVDRTLGSLASLSQHADQATAGLADLVDKVRRGEGTAGALLLDPEIYDDVKAMVRDLERNPWKFLWKQ